MQLLSDDTLARLLALSQLGTTCVCQLDGQALARVLLPRMLPAAAASQGLGLNEAGWVRWVEDGATAGPNVGYGSSQQRGPQPAGLSTGAAAGPGSFQVTRMWVMQLWQWLQSQAGSLAPFTGLPILPVLLSPFQGQPGMSGAGAKSVPPVHPGGLLLPLPDKATSSVISAALEDLTPLIPSATATAATDDSATATAAAPQQEVNSDTAAAAPPQPSPLSPAAEQGSPPSTTTTTMPDTTPPGQPPEDPRACLVLSLASLGVTFVDHVNFGQQLPQRLLLGGHCHGLEGPGPLAALHALEVGMRSGGRGNTPPGSHGSAATAGSARTLWARAFAQAPALSAVIAGRVVGAGALQPLPGALRNALRSALLCEPSMSGLFRLGAAQARAMLATLSCLPIYEAPYAPPTDPTGLHTPQPTAGAQGVPGAAAASTAATSGTGSAGGASSDTPDDSAPAAPPFFTDLLGSPCYLLPDSCFTPLPVLPHKYVVARRASEGRAMVQHLGVVGLSAADAYKQHVLPALPRLLSAPRNTLLRSMLGSLPALTAQDQGLAGLLRATPIVPNCRGALCAPGALYDPRVPELAGGWVGWLFLM